MDSILQWVFRQKMRFDFGLAMMGIVNFVLLVITAGDKIFLATGIPTRWLVVLLLPVVILLVWLVGYVLDRWMRMVQLTSREINARNELATETFETVKKIEEMLRKGGE